MGTTSPFYKLLDTGGNRPTYVIPGLARARALLLNPKGNQVLGEATDMDPQGLASIEDKYIDISAYSKTKTYNSII
ncbi:hypothetical protein [Streptococcus saliviloxodontae]|uniref:Uncharacterized protein n=1 Tax=Streptococcus saliviloxodontae TaxID=1349416 RepID=A0ABS2PIM1_9STRE|nr:hypothetical protein [Streptococcus saliviloxodontae]MBM7635270.1 hypothetical protein [Streptococcus saliviloxodontae]